MKDNIDDEAIKKILLAGKIAGEAREYGAQIVKAGRKTSEICNAVEDFIRERGAEPAFPCNVSINEIAAHYTPGLFDDMEIPECAVVKVDVGAHVDGYIGDTAVTVDLCEKYEKLLEASREALNTARKVLRSGINLYELGKVIQNQIKKRGYKVIKNLTGHTIGRYLIHSGISIPNYADRLSIVIRISPSTLLAIEPFATNGRGLVKEGSITNIYSYTGKRPKGGLNDAEEKVLEIIERRFRTLPFTPRWILRELKIDKETLERTIKSLQARKALHGYPVLVEAGRGIVAQFEHSFLVLKDRVLVTTEVSSNT